VTNATPNVSPAGSSGAEISKDKAMQLINDFQDISFTKIGLIIFGTWLTIVIIRRLLPFLANKGPSQLRLYILAAVPILRLTILVFAILWLIPIIFNITFQNFLVIAGAASVAIGFAFKDYASSLIAGIVAIIERPYRPGDWVEIADDYGEVKTVGLRAIKILTASDDMITIPHDRIWKDNISNSNDGSYTLMCVVDFYVRHDHDAAIIRAALLDVGLTSAYLSYEKPVMVMLKQTVFGTHYKLKAYPFDMRNQFSFISDLTVRGKKAIADNGGHEISLTAAAEAQITNHKSGLI